MDFSTSQPPSILDFFTKITVSVLIWICIISLVKRISHTIATKFCSKPIAINVASIPSKIPHPNPPGSAIPFDIPLLNATDDQIQAFMEFRGGILSLPLGEEMNNNKPPEERRVIILQHVANSAAEYKGLLYQERAMKWIDEHFRLHKSNLRYPYVGRHW